MSIYIRLAPGVKIRLGRRGMRTSLGPRLLRAHFGGGGGTGVSTGIGPVSLYKAIQRRATTVEAATSAALATRLAGR